MKHTIKAYEEMISIYFSPETDQEYRQLIKNIPHWNFYYVRSVLKDEYIIYDILVDGWIGEEYKITVFFVKNWIRLPFIDKSEIVKRMYGDKSKTNLYQLTHKLTNHKGLMFSEPEIKHLDKLRSEFVEKLIAQQP